MKRTVTILLGVLFFAGAPVALTNAADVVISIGDRPYYTRGPFYVENGVRWEWVPGHWSTKKHKKRAWVHGHYVRR
jgi:hypothetical protein